jgi:arylformamidase
MYEMESAALVDLSHIVEHGMVTYKGLPAPLMCDYLSREASRSIYGDGVEFQIGRIDMVANTGTYIDTPFHRYATGTDLSGIALEQVAALPVVVVRAPHQNGLAVDADRFAALDVAGKAVLVHTDWDQHWRTDRYFEGHPFLTAAAADRLRDAGAVLVGIDSHNIDDTRHDGPGSRRRPVHSTLLGAGILIVEHLTNLGAMPNTGARFSAVPVKMAGMGTFPVRAYATVPGRA